MRKNIFKRLLILQRRVNEKIYGRKRRGSRIIYNCRIKTSIIPKEWLEEFPNNELNNIKSQEVIYI